MNLLFVHQNFPGQFKYLAPALAQAGHQVRALAIEGAGLPQIPMLRYRIGRGSSRDIHPLARDFETKLIRGDACAAAAVGLVAMLLPEHIARKIPLNLVWLLPILAIPYVVYSLMPWWTH